MTVYWTDGPDDEKKRNFVREEEEAMEKYHPSARCPCEICQTQIADYTYDEAMDPDFVPPGVDE